MGNIKITKRQAKVLYDAMWDLEETGATEIKCPKCGNKLILDASGNSATVRCKTEGCLSATRHGL